MLREVAVVYLRSPNRANNELKTASRKGVARCGKAIDHAILISDDAGVFCAEVQQMNAYLFDSASCMKEDISL